MTIIGFKKKIILCRRDDFEFPRAVIATDLQSAVLCSGAIMTEPHVHKVQFTSTDVAKVMTNTEYCKNMMRRRHRYTQ